MTQDDFEQGYRLGYGTGYDIGWRSGVADEQDAWDRMFRAPYLDDWRLPDREELAKLRTPDWQPCRTRCQACSRCIASMAYWARGGHPFLGVGA